MIDGMRLSLIAHHITIGIPTLRHQLEVSAEAQPVLVQRECLTQLVLHLLPGLHLCILPLKFLPEPLQELRERTYSLIRQRNLLRIRATSHWPPFETAIA